jgi:hypothetical protein
MYRVGKLYHLKTIYLYKNHYLFLNIRNVSTQQKECIFK